MPRRNLTVLVVMLLVSWLCYQRAGRNRYAATLAESMNLITEHYLHEVEPRVLFEGAMDGLVDQLDPYSGYTSPEEFAQFQQQMDGEFTGVGIVVDPDADSGALKVVEALIGKPAYLKGIRAGDVILAIDGQVTQDLPVRDAVRLIRGRAGTTVRMRIQHPGRDEAAEYELERATIPLESVLGDARRSDGRWVYRLVDHPRIGYIRIANFGERTADEFRAALASFREPGQAIDGLLLDLRYNAGGLLSAATEVCDELLDEGRIVTTRGRYGRVMAEYHARAGVGLPRELPLVVLVDRLSASASEIVAACLQDHGRAAVAGQRSWGKGTVQNVVNLEGGRSALRLTIGSYHRPSGKEIHKWKDAQEDDDWGVRPDPGLEALLTNRQNDLIVAARRQRDLVSWEELASAELVGDEPPYPAAEPSPPAPAATDTPDGPPTPTPDAEESPEGAEEASAVAAEAARAAQSDPARWDPQLEKALEHLQRQAEGRAAKSKKA